jgi:hypothetical protein
MANRIKTHARRYGRDSSVVAATVSTHLIRIGWNIGTDGKKQPAKLAGFLICHDSLGEGNKPVIDYDAMARLGCSPEQVADALKRHWNADGLPQSLRFVLMQDGQIDEDGGYLYPGIIAESYEHYTAAGLFCYGDGVSCSRKQIDGTRKTLPCVPYGRRDSTPESFCQWSGPGKPCKLHYRLSVCLLCDDGTPLSPELGMQARARLDSTSEYGAMGALDALDAAAPRLALDRRVLLSGITGTLTFSKRNRRKESGAAIVGHVSFVLDEEAIRRREREISEYIRMRDQRAISYATAGLPAPSDARLLPPAPDATEIDEAEEPTPAQSPARDREELTRPHESPNPAPAPSMQFEVVSETVGEEIADADPFGAHDEAPRLPDRLAVADATDAQLSDALWAYATRIAAEGGVEPADALAEVAYFDHEGKRYPIRHVRWFEDGSTTAKRAARLAHLRRICEMLEAEHNPYFVIEAPVVPAGSEK